MPPLLHQLALPITAVAPGMLKNNKKKKKKKQAINSYFSGEAENGHGLSCIISDQSDNVIATK